VPGSRFLHFGSTRQLVESGAALLAETGDMPEYTVLKLNNQMAEGGGVTGSDGWVEGCRISAPVSLGAGSVLIGVDVHAPLALPARAALDVVEGFDAFGRTAWFIRCYGVDDSFKDATFCGHSLADWLAAVGASPATVWDDSIPPAERTLWNARVFPAEPREPAFACWLWMYAPESASGQQKQQWLAASRHSAAEISQLAGHEAFFSRRATIRANAIGRSWKPVLPANPTVSNP
jgi:hypothetical protein